MSFNMNMIFTVRMISTLLGAAACILGRVTLAPAAPAEPIHNIVLGGEGACFRMVLVTKNGLWSECGAEVKYCFHNKNEKKKADE
jgi:hypothetical protein